jgi:hypothetical protein
MRPYSGGPLTATDYERILDVAGECGATRSLSAFRETLIESLASHLGYRHAGLLLGPTRSRIFQDADVLTIGRAIRLVPSYTGDSGEALDHHRHSEEARQGGMPEGPRGESSGPGRQDGRARRNKGIDHTNKATRSARS